MNVRFKYKGYVDIYIPVYRYMGNDELSLPHHITIQKRKCLLFSTIMRINFIITKY